MTAQLRKARRDEQPQKGRSRPPADGQRARLAAAALVIAAAAVFAYLPSLSNGFVDWDDLDYVKENPHVAALNWKTISWAFSHIYCHNWHPLTWFSHAIDCELYGVAQARGHHQTSLLLHAASAVLVLIVFRRLTGRLWASAALAALFALHPLHVESVAWVAERKDVLCGLFFLLAMWAYAAYAQEPSPRPFWFRRSYWLALAAFAAALMSKPMAVTLPFVLLVLDWWPLRRLGRLAVLEKLPMLVMAGLASWVTLAAQQTTEAVKSLKVISLGERLANVPVSYARYLAQTLWPWPGTLVPYHPLAREGGPALTPALVWSCVAVLVALTLAAVLLRRQRPYLLVGWLWFLGMMVPVIGLVKVGFQAMADRYTYLPLLGVFMALAWLVGDMVAQRPSWRKVVAVLAVVLFLILGGLTARQQRIWRNQTTLWQAVYEVYPGNALARYNLGQEYTKQDPRRGLNWFRESVQRIPDDADLHCGLADALSQVGDYDASVAEYRMILERWPEKRRMRLNLGLVLSQKGDFRGAVREYRILLKDEPNMMAAHQNLAAALYRLGDEEGARKELAEAARLRELARAEADER